MKLTKKKFGLRVVKYAHDNDMSLMESMIDVCTKSDLPLDEVGRYVDQPLKEKIEAEVSKLNLLQENHKYNEL